MSRQLIIRVDDSFLDAIKQRATNDGMNVSEFVRAALRAELSREPWKPVTVRPATALEFRYGGKS